MQDCFACALDKRFRGVHCELESKMENDKETRGGGGGVVMEKIHSLTLSEVDMEIDYFNCKRSGLRRGGEPS